MSPSEPRDDEPDTPVARAAALRAALEARGLHADVRADGALALLRVEPEIRDLAQLFDRATRAELARLGRVEGFTHVAIEI